MKAQVLPSQCAVCGKLLLAGRIVIDLWDNHYHPECRQKRTSCSACNRSVSSRLTGGGVTYADGRVVCNLCRATALDHAEQARPIVRQVADWLYARGLRFDGLSLNLDLGSRHALEGPQGDRSSPTGAGTGQILGRIMTATSYRNGYQKRHVKGVSILSGLPQELFQGVLAHELGHAWLFLAQVDHLHAWQEEGFCNLLSYILHRDHTTKEARHWIRVLEKDPSPIYGEGFRRVRSIFKKRGFGTALNYIYHHRQFPAG